jgi:beta-glucosidase
MNPALDVDKRVKLLLNEMTLEEKVAQLYTILNGLDKPNRFNADSARFYFPQGTGFLWLGDQCRNPKDFVKMVNEVQRYFVNETRLGIPALIGAEALHGFVAKGATSFPQNIALGGTFDPELIEKIYAVAGREMRAWGINQTFSPNLDLGREPRFGRVEETYGEDPYLTSQIGLAAVRGLQGRNHNDLKGSHVIATLKHYAGHGEPLGGRNQGPINSVNSVYFHENHLLPFEVAVKEGNALCVMASYNDADGIPNHSNKTLLTDYLVKNFGFNGYVIGDLEGVARLLDTHYTARNHKEVAEQCFNAGLDVELTSRNTSFKTIGELVKEGKISIKRLDEAVFRILRLKFLLGLFDKPFVDEQNVLSQTNTAQDKALALEAAEKSAVLLKNENVLPFNESKIKKLAVIGPMAGSIHLGGYSFEPFEGISILEGLQNFGKGKFEVIYAEGCKISTTPATFWGSVNPVPNSRKDDGRLIDEAIKTASTSDAIVLVIGENESFSREAWSETHLGDRESLELPGLQNELVEALLKLGKPMVAIMVGGRPLSFNLVAERVPAIFQAWYLGQETGTAIANLLFGKANPSGKLCISIPRSVGQLPAYYSQLPSQIRSYLWANTTPLFQFGHGLSYSKFEYSNPILSKPIIKQGENVVVKVSVTNTGVVSGDEVVQLYIRDQISSVVRPILQLKDFKRIDLEPGETKTVEFIIDNSKLSFFNKDLKRIVEPGDFDIKVGGNSIDLKTVKLTLE